MNIMKGIEQLNARTIGIGEIILHEWNNMNNEFDIKTDKTGRSIWLKFVMMSTNSYRYVGKELVQIDKQKAMIMMNNCGSYN